MTKSGVSSFAIKYISTFRRTSREVVQSKTSLLICLVFLWTVIGPNLFGIESTLEASIAERGAATTASTGIDKLSSLTINKPTGVIEGDVMIATIATSVSNNTMSVSSPGWTNVFPATSLDHTITGSGEGHIYVQVFWRVAAASENTSYTFAISVGSGSNHAQTMAGSIMAYSGVDNLNPLDVSSARKHDPAATLFPTNAITTTVDGAYVVGAFGVANSPSLGGCDALSPSTSTESSAVLGTEMAESCTQASLSTNVSSELQQYIQSVAGPVRLEATTSTSSALGFSHILALRPAVHHFNQSAYRWFANINSIDFLGISHNVSQDVCATAAMDQALSVVHHATQDWVIMVGYDGCNSEQWQIQKRNTLDGVLVEDFGNLGTITHNGPTTGSDRATSVARDNDGYFYVGGYETITSGLAANTQWRIEKRNSTNGALVASFGNNGIITADITSGENDRLEALYVDTTNRVLYAAGLDNSPVTGGDSQWRIHKYNIDTGQICDGSTINGNDVCVGGQFGSSGVVTSNPELYEDVPISIFVDENAGTDANNEVISYLYVGGYQSPSDKDKAWRLEKRNARSGVLCTSTTACPEGGFNTGTGIYTTNPTTNSGGDDQISTVEIEVVNQSTKHVYLGGRDKTGGNLQWRMEKLDAITGALRTDFDTDGILTVNPDGNDDDTITSFSVDTADDILYIIGTDAGGGRTNNAPVDYKWRLEKRNSITGALCDGGGTDTEPTCWYKGAKAPRFGADPDPPGVATSNPVDGSCGTIDCNSASTHDYDRAVDMRIDTYGDALFIVGYDGAETTTTGDASWRLEKRNLEDGTRQFDMSPIAQQDTAAKPFRVNMDVRLRMLLHVDPTSIFTTDTSLPNFKLQYAEKVGTCDTLFDGEVYQDVQTTSGLLKWLDNTSAKNGAIPRDLGTDPQHSTHSTIIQGYYEQNPFTIQKSIPGGNDGLYDLALEDQEAFGSFCIRAVYDDGTANGALFTTKGGGYSVVPEINFCMYPPMDKLMRHGNYFCGNIENPFYWSARIDLQE